MSKYSEYKNLNLSQIGKDILKFWEDEKIFEKSVSTREGTEPFVFYEGPPSANGMPGIHHVMARAIKDIFCRYQTLKGKQVKRKAGWDTHGLPIELAVEKSLGITKEDIGNKKSSKYISVEDYNKECRKEVMKYKDKWEELTRIMGYWVDMEHPYITYENNYIESVWYLLKKLYDKKLLYKGYTIQPYSPAAGTGLSTHEINQPGCYRNVKDTSAVAMFRVSQKSKEKIQKLISSNEQGITNEEVCFLAWTTTPWTLPSNTALAVGKAIDYVLVVTVNRFTEKTCFVILAHDLYKNYFPQIAIVGNYTEDEIYKLQNPTVAEALQGIEGCRKEKKLFFSGKPIGYVIARFKGEDLEGISYEQLLPFVKIENDKAFKVYSGDFVSTEEGTGIVHIAPTFGSDDFNLAMKNDIPPAVIKELGGLVEVPLVDKQGKFCPEVKDGVFLYGGEYVKEAYLSEEEKETEFQKQKMILESKEKIKNLKEYLNVDERIVLKLQEEGALFKKEKYEHSYPHCWRTDKPILYYPLHAWFVKVTAYKDRMVELNKTINWKPEHTGTGRFGEWLNNLQDWNLSRSRFWGIPLPIWKNDPARWQKKRKEKCIGSVDELFASNAYFLTEKAVHPQIGERMTGVALSVMRGRNESRGRFDDYSKLLKASIEKGEIIPISKLNKKDFDLHRPLIDYVFFYEDDEILAREPDLIDVWFDSGAMPYAQLHYPFENNDQIDKKKYFPADFIAEGVDQTRGWFYTLHAIACLCFDSVAYKNVVSNGLVLDKNGNKMSKRLGNAVDPFSTLEKYGPDAVRWYMVTNADPWDNLKFDIEGVAEKQRTFFGTLYNIYAFFALYANVDKFIFAEKEIPIKERPEIDQWILSELNSLIKLADESYSHYEPTKAGRAIENFVDEHLSNWYVRLCRRRFWKGEYMQDKISAYQTLYKCMEVVAQLSSPIAPFFCEKLFKDLNDITKKQNAESVHLSIFPKADVTAIDKPLEERMEMAQKISSMILSIRKKENIRVRQPLTQIRVPILDDSFKKKLEAVKDLILSEVNVKEIEYVSEKDTQIVKNLKLNFKTLGKKCGKHMKTVQAFAIENAQTIISTIEKNSRYEIKIENETIELLPEDVEIIPIDIPGWKVANSGALTVALDITITDTLRDEGIAREIVNRIQNLRKEKKFEITDRIEVMIKGHQKINSAVRNNLDYICAEILATKFEIVNDINGNGVEIEVDEEIKTMVAIDRNNNKMRDVRCEM
ncbi:MAG: class I tRNA ligase family protein [Bacteroidota bacterium]